MRNLAIRTMADLQPGTQVVAAMSHVAAANLATLGPDTDRFYLVWDMRQDLTRYCLKPEDVANETAWTVLKADNDGKWVELHLALAVHSGDGHVRVLLHEVSERASARVECIDPR